ncbi:hypothetical protein SUGI_0555460 [Cryptomeria japonica]|nr:hypothetical protein SUGI_0555460 [Cryptomeria japonica]
MEIWAVRISQILRIYFPVVLLFLYAWNVIPETSLEQAGDAPTDAKIIREIIQIGLQAWKRAITADPQGVLDNWVGPAVCNYIGVYFAPPLDKSVDKVVAGVDLNHARLTGTKIALTMQSKIRKNVHVLCD